MKRIICVWGVVFANNIFAGFFFEEWLKGEQLRQEERRKERKKTKELKKKTKLEKRNKRRNRDQKSSVVCCCHSRIATFLNDTSSGGTREIFDETKN